MEKPNPTPAISGFYRFYICLPVIAIFFGGIIYILFRPSEHVFFNWIRAAGFTHLLSVIRHNTFFTGLHLPGWIVFSLPNGLWAFAYAFLITAIWSGSQSWLKYFWMASIPLLVLGYEMLQYKEFIPGTFCMQDITLGTAGLILGIIIGLKITKLKRYEKAIQ